MKPRILSRLAGLFGRNAESALDEDIAAHLAALEAEHLKEGLSEQEAQAAARRDFGSIALLKETHREERGVHIFDSLRQDVRYTGRLMRRAPGLSATIVLVAGLGIGSNAAIFSLLDATLWQPVPVHDPNSLFVLSWTADRNPRRSSSVEIESCVEPTTKPPAFGCTFPAPLVQELRASGAFAKVAGFTGPVELAFSGRGPASFINTYFVSGAFFETIGVKAGIGRTIVESDDVEGAEPVVVLSYALWTRAFAADTAVVGQQVRLNGTKFTVVGVADRQFSRLSPGFLQDAWIPRRSLPRLGLQWLPKSDDEEGFWEVEVVARLPPGASRSQVAAQATGVFNRWIAGMAEPALPREAQGMLHVTPAQEALLGVRDSLSRPALLLMSAVGLLLVLVCANVAGLLLARNASRRQEIAIRYALGAGRGRVARQIIVEGLVLSGCGGIAGLVLAMWGGQVLVAFLEAGRIGETSLSLQLNGRVLLFLFGATMGTGLLFGAAPAFSSTREGLSSALKERGSEVFRWRADWLPSIGHLLVIAQIALSVLLLFLGGLLIRSLVNLQRVDPGFDVRNLLVFGIDPGRSGYTPPRSLALLRDVQTKLGALPGVTSVTYATSALLTGSIARSNFDRPDGSGQSVEVETLNIAPNFFQTMGIPILAGRSLTDADVTARSGGAVVNQAFVREYLGRSSAVEDLRPGEYALVDGRKIVGVVGDVKIGSLRSRQRPAMFAPLRFNFFTTYFSVRTSVAPELVAASVRQLVAETDASLPVLQFQTQDETIGRALYVERLFARVAAIFSFGAVVLVSVGLYGLLAYIVTERTRDIGIRLALGERPARIQHLVVRQGLTLAAAGLAIGIPLALISARWLTSMTFSVNAHDPVALTGVFVLISVVSALAAWIPARRAAAVDPMVALRRQ